MPRFFIVKLKMAGNRLANRDQMSIRARSHASAGRPWSATCAAFASSIKPETSTPAGHSVRQSWQWTQRSALARSSSDPQSFGSSVPEAICRNKFACARGEADSDLDARKLGHIRKEGSVVRHAPHPLHAAA